MKARTFITLLLVLAMAHQATAGPLLAAAHRRNADPLPVLLLWLEADQITGLTDNAPIASWVDRGTGGNNATQASPTAQPLWIASDAGFNGRPSVLFDNAGDYMQTTCSLTAPFTLIVVVRAVGTAAGNHRSLSSVDQNRALAVYRNSNAVYNGGAVLNDDTVNGTTAHIISLAVGAESHVYIDGVDTTDDTTKVNDWGSVALGNSFGESGNCAIAAVGAFSAVDSTERQRVEAVWKVKYGTP